MAASPIDVYRRQIERELQAGNATEHTHRPALKALIESLASGVTATNEPKQVECGAPDFVVSRKATHGPVTLGHIEAKDVGKDLGEIERSDQMKRYLPALPNLILTDYLEFRWYVDGQRRGDPARLVRVIKGGKLAPEKGGADAVTDLLTAFLAREAQPINAPKALALRMARLTHFIRDMIVTAFDRQSASATLRDLHKAFEKSLIPDLPIPQFADMFAQTLAYGLFAARCNHRGPRGSFKRLGAATEIPKTNPFLRQLFETITGTALDEEPFVGFVDDLAQLLADTDMEAVLADFGKRTAREDPVVHFYETFLAAYDPKLRESRGVYYTPEPVVSYLVRSVDYLLRTHFGCPNGLADTTTVEYEREEDGSGGLQPGKGAKKVKATSPRVLILDPACGTGTFLYAVVDLIRSEFMRQGNAGMWSGKEGYVHKQLLPRIFGFELLMAPYAVAHFKLGMQLGGHDLTPAQREKWAYDFSGDERLGVFLTNTLEEAESKAETLFGPLRVITQEANAATQIKRNMPILAVIGNPPYSNFGQMNKGEWITGLMGDWKPEGEKKWNPDDFMKFMRWAQWRIARTGQGVLAFVTNNSYIDGITRRQMRQSMMEAFSEIYILDLHGSSMKKERCPDGSKDENVFDIQQGVTLGIFVKEPNKAGPAKVSHADLWGLRETKYQRLFETDITITKWTALDPNPPNFFFVPSQFHTPPGTGVPSEYSKARSVTHIFPTYSSGFQTKRDKVAVAETSAKLKSIVKDFASMTAEELSSKYELPPDGRDWKTEWATKHARNLAANPTSFVRCLYRPFDTRWTVLDDVSKGFVAYPRFDVMRHMTKENLGIITTRQLSQRSFCHVLATRQIIDGNTISLQTREYSYLFPLYLYPSTQAHEKAQADLDVQTSHWPSSKDERKPNLTPDLVADLEKQLGLRFVSDEKGGLKKTFGPEDVFDYIYAVFHSPTYRTRYAEFLKSDFPRVPLTSDVNLFRVLCAKGAELVALHLLESPLLGKPIARYPVKGADLVDKGFPKYVAPGEPEPGTGKPVKEGRVYINAVAPVYDRRSAPALAERRYKTGDETSPLQEGQYFEGIPPEVWNFHIGGYRVCEKWLKDRRGRTLTYDDLEHYCRVVTALSETIRLMAEIDAAIPKWPLE
jgi:hypothetical protein